MKWLFCFALISLSLSTQAQSHYTVHPDQKAPGSFYLLGIINKYRIENDSAYTWYNSSRSSFVPNSKLLNAMESAKAKYKILLFGGTWCEDTQFILPKFFKAQEMSGFPDNAVSFIAVDRDKRAPGNLSAVFGVTNVPTIIVMKEGKETGRIVEYGKTGKWDEELADFLLQP
jgi:thiol-disulfide isomerase/thioredoxin